MGFPTDDACQQNFSANRTSHLHSSTPTLQYHTRYDTCRPLQTFVQSRAYELHQTTLLYRLMSLHSASLATCLSAGQNSDDNTHWHRADVGMSPLTPAFGALQSARTHIGVYDKGRNKGHTVIVITCNSARDHLARRSESIQSQGASATPDGAWQCLCLFACAGTTSSWRRVNFAGMESSVLSY